MPTAKAWLVGLLWLAAAGVAAADTVRVTRDRAIVWSSPGGVSIIVSQLPLNAVVDVVRKVGAWYEIVLPPDASRIPTRTGYIRDALVVIESTGPRSADATRLLAGPRRPSRPRPTTILHVDGTRRFAAPNLTRTSAPFAAAFAEAGRLEADYGRADGWQLDVLVGQTFTRTLGVGIGASYTRRSPTAAIAAEVPHPFYFDRLRPATFTTGPLDAHEAAVHIPLFWMPTTRGRLKVVLFGGPSVFRVSQSVAVNLTMTDPYPHDAAVVGGAAVETRTATGAGFLAGADVGLFFTRRVGVGVGARYSRAPLTFHHDEDATTSGAAGAAQVTAGLRVRF